jgi:hypothetical protein
MFCFALLCSAFALLSSLCADVRTGVAIRRCETLRTPRWVTLRGMGLRVSTEPQQGASYDDLLGVAKAVDNLGFDRFFQSDHYLTFGGNGLPEQ